MFFGDFALNSTIDVKFSTIDSTGAPITLAGSPAVSAYPGNSTTELTAGITLTVDFDARTGLHNVRVVATSGNGYAAATNYALVLTAGTVSGVSVVGYVVAHFSLDNRVASTNTTTLLSRVVGTLATGTHNPQSGDAFARLGAPAGASVSADVAAVQADTDNLQTRIPAALVSGRIDASVGAMAANVVTATAIAADAITDAKVAADVTIASVTGSVGSVTGAVGSVTGTVGSVTGAVGSVTAAVAVTAASVRTAVGLASANLDTQLDAIPTAAETADAVWDETTVGHQTAGTTGKALTDAGGAGTPPTAAAIASQVRTELATELGRVDVAVSTRSTLTAAQVNAEADTALLDVGLTSTVTGRIDVASSTRMAGSAYVAPLDALGVRTALGMGAADLDGQIDNLAAAIGTLPAAPTASENADALLDRTNAIEAGITPRGALRLQLAALAGKVSGAESPTISFRNVGDTTDRIVATTDDAGNRSAVTVNPA